MECCRRPHNDDDDDNVESVPKQNLFRYLVLALGPRSDGVGAGRPSVFVFLRERGLAIAMK